MPQKKRAEPGATTRAKSSASASETAKAKIAVAEPESVSARQIKSYELGIRAFREQRLVEARDFFQEASTGPLPAVAHNARLHLGICERRGKNGVLKFESPEEHYNYAVERINSGNLTEARQHLLTAQSALPDGDHVLYALAACDALSGDLPAAYENLKRAIDLNPRNRLNARTDPDFAEAARSPLLQPLLYPEKTNSF